MTRGRLRGYRGKELNAMPNRPRRHRLRAWLLVAVIGGLVAAGCGGVEPPPSPDSEQYKEAKKRGNEARAKEYGRRSIDEKKATVNPEEPSEKKG
jgi:hypothetical protein